MPAEQADVVDVRVGQAVQSGWTQYSIDSHMLTPADAWSASIAAPGIAMPTGIEPGSRAEVRIGGELVMNSTLDDVNLSTDKSGMRLDISGRDAMGVLIDCSSAVFTGSMLTLDEIVAKIVRPLGITRIRIEAEKTALRDRVSVEPGDTAWESLRRAAEAAGLWSWVDPDGTLVVGGPKYSAEPVGELVLRTDGKGNNVLSLAERRSIHSRYSDVTVLGQCHASGQKEGSPHVRVTVKDPSVTVYRPRIVVDHEAVTPAIARARARKVISDSRVNAYELVATVAGHRSSTGVLWMPGQRVKLVSQAHSIDAIFFIMGRRFTCDKSAGQRTRLVLKEDGAWVLDAHPSHRRHRSGKNGPLRVFDLNGEAE